MTVRFLERHGHMISHITPKHHLYISFISFLFLNFSFLNSKKYRIFWFYGLLYLYYLKIVIIIFKKIFQYFIK